MLTVNCRLMPVKKTKMSDEMPITSPLSSSQSQHDCCFKQQCSTSWLRGMHATDFGRRFLWALFGIILVYGIVFLGTLIRNNLREFYFIGHSPREERTITVQGEGKVPVRPDVATVNLGMTADGATAAEAQTKNTTVMNNLITALKSAGVVEDDIQTNNYNIYPIYDYENGSQTLRGYQVSQDVRVKIRNLDQSGTILALAGDVGATNVSGLQFTIDDEEKYLEQARNLALDDARQQAQKLSQALGVNLVAVVGYDENQIGGVQPPYPYMAEARSLLFDVPTPTVEPGSTEVGMQVRVVFEIR